MSKIDIKNNKAWLRMQKTCNEIHRVNNQGSNIYHILYVKHSNDKKLLAIPWMSKILNYDILNDGHIEEFVYG